MSSIPNKMQIDRFNNFEKLYTASFVNINIDSNTFKKGELNQNEIF